MRFQPALLRQEPALPPCFLRRQHGGGRPGNVRPPPRWAEIEYAKVPPPSITPVSAPLGLLAAFGPTGPPGRQQRQASSFVCWCGGCRALQSLPTGAVQGYHDAGSICPAGGSDFVPSVALSAGRS